MGFLNKLYFFFKKKSKDLNRANIYQSIASDTKTFQTDLNSLTLKAEV